MLPPSPEQVAEALHLLQSLHKELTEAAQNYALKLEYGAESDENRSLREYFRTLGDKVLQAKMTLEGPRYKPSAELADGEGWVVRRDDGVELAIEPANPEQELANPDSVVRER